MTRYETLRKQLGDTLTKDYQGHSYGSTQFNVAESGYNRTTGNNTLAILEELQAAIPAGYLVQDGLEKTLHVTVKYGLVDSITADDVKQAVSSSGIINVELGWIKCFENEDADVVYVECNGEQLTELNSLISRELECVDTHPTYTPHITLAYVQSGSGKEVVDILTGLTEDEQGTLEGYAMSFQHLIFSPAEGDVVRIDLLSESKQWHTWDDGGMPPTTVGASGLVNKAVSSVQDGINLYERLASNQSITIESARQQFQELRVSSKEVLIGVARYLGARTDGSKDAIASRILMFIEGIVGARVRGQDISSMKSKGLADDAVSEFKRVMANYAIMSFQEIESVITTVWSKLPLGEIKNAARSAGVTVSGSKTQMIAELVRRVKELKVSAQRTDKIRNGGGM